MSLSLREPLRIFYTFHAPDLPESGLKKFTIGTRVFMQH